MRRKFRVSAVAAPRGWSEVEVLVAEGVFETARGEQSTQQKQLLAKQKTEVGSIQAGTIGDINSTKDRKWATDCRSSVGKAKPFSAIQQWVQNEEPVIFGTTKLNTKETYQWPQVGTSERCGDRHQVTPCSACSMKPRWGRKQTVGENRVERNPGWKEVSTWAAESRWELWFTPGSPPGEHSHTWSCFASKHSILHLRSLVLLLVSSPYDHLL